MKPAHAKLARTPLRRQTSGGYRSFAGTTQGGGKPPAPLPTPSCPQSYTIAPVRSVPTYWNGRACYHQLPRIPILGNSVNKGIRKGRGFYAPTLPMAGTLAGPSHLRGRSFAGHLWVVLCEHPVRVVLPDPCVQVVVNRHPGLVARHRPGELGGRLARKHRRGLALVPPNPLHAYKLKVAVGLRGIEHRLGLQGIASDTGCKVTINDVVAVDVVVAHGTPSQRRLHATTIGSDVAVCHCVV